jgi:hypothetical protein
MFAQILRPRRAQEQKVSDRPVGRGQASEMRLICRYNLVNSYVLSNDEAAELPGQIFRLPFRHGRVE